AERRPDGECSGLQLDIELSTGPRRVHRLSAAAGILLPARAIDSDGFWRDNPSGVERESQRRHDRGLLHRSLATQRPVSTELPNPRPRFAGWHQSLLCQRIEAPDGDAVPEPEGSGGNRLLADPVDSCVLE